MRHGVVQFPGESLPLAGTHPLQLPLASGRPEPHGRPDHRRQEQEHEAHDLVDGRGIVRDDRQREGREDHHAPEHDLPARSPPGQRVHQHQHDHAGVQADRLPRGGHQRGHPEHDHRAEPERDHRQRAGPAPQRQHGTARRRTPPPPAATRRRPAAWPPAPHRPGRRRAAPSPATPGAGAPGAVVPPTGFAGRLAAWSQPRERAAPRIGRKNGASLGPGTGSPRPASRCPGAAAATSLVIDGRTGRPTRCWRTRCSRRPSPAWAGAPPGIPGG